MPLNMTEVAGAQTQGAPASGIVEIAERLRRSSVLIGYRRGGGGGSGVIWETGANKSVIITNAHVVKNRRARVTLRDGRTSEGHVTNFDARRDLAALTLDVGGLPVATIGDSDALRVGELVFAVGNPLGLVGALAVGVVHASGKHWVGADVRLAPGNSGGMLADAEGRVVGINSMIANNLAFAVPSNAVKRFLARDTRPQLGIKIRALPVTQDGSDMLGLLVFEVQSGSAAEGSGLLIGDIIVGTRERLFTNSNGLATALEDAAASKLEKLELSLIRGGKKIHWPVTFQINKPEMEAK
ncbi:MAG TPA: trypsin-like peptidase domain-containing protein [Blastocatellia bacterium]|nr:trypsin-like peptidase domain-containing protein [Blastocatellia bacterium]